MSGIPVVRDTASRPEMVTVIGHSPWLRWWPVWATGFLAAPLVPIAGIGPGVCLLASGLLLIAWALKVFFLDRTRWFRFTSVKLVIGVGGGGEVVRSAMCIRLLPVERGAWTARRLLGLGAGELAVRVVAGAAAGEEYRLRNVLFAGRKHAAIQKVLSSNQPVTIEGESDGN